MPCEAGGEPYLRSMRAEQVTFPAGEVCQVLVTWEYGDEPFDVVEINWCPANELDNPPAFEPRRLPYDPQTTSETIVVRTGTSVVVFVWPRWLDDNNFLELSHDDSDGNPRPWFEFCLGFDFGTKRTPSQDAGAGRCVTSPTIISHELTPGAITVHWNNPEQFNMFAAEANAPAFAALGGSIDTGEIEATAWTITRTRTGETYRFRARGLHQPFAGSECATPYGPWYPVTVPQGMGYTPPSFNGASSLAAVSRAEQFTDLFAVGTQGHVVSTARHSGGAWSMWFGVGTKSFGADAKLAALSRDPDFMDVFTIGHDGQAYVSWWNGNPWREWAPVVDDHVDRFTSGAALVANSRTPDHMDLFAIDQDGHVVQTWWNGPPWRAWQQMSGRDFPPGGHIAAVNRHSDHMELWAVGLDGLMHGAFWNGGAWTWYPLSGQTFPPGAPVAAVTRNSEHMEVFAIGDDGQMHHRWWTGGGWYPEWGTLVGPTFRSGTPVTAQVLHGDDMHVFAVDETGGVCGIHFNEVWDDWYVVPTGAREGALLFGAPIASAVPWSPVVNVFTVSLADKALVFWSSFNSANPAQPKPLL